MAEANPILPCVLLPMQDCQLLLPNVSLAEVVDYATPQRGSQGPDWYLGRFSWRGISLPVISYDAANGATPQTPDTARGRIAVLNTIGPQHEQLPFLAVVTQGIPRLAKVDADALRAVDGRCGPADLMQAELEGMPVTIPNVEYLESLAAQL